MTAYHGGKQSTGKSIAEVVVSNSMNIEDDSDFVIQGYCEPFCGMLGVYKHIPSLYCARGKTDLEYLAGDTNSSVIKMWKASQRGWKPPTRLISEKEFTRLKVNGKSSAEKGFIGHQYGYMGRYFMPFRRHRKSTINRISTKISEMGRVLMNVSFYTCAYDMFTGLEGFVIYCDPPYATGSMYYDEQGVKIPKFNQCRFWDWCRMMSDKNIVFVSEYNAPDDFHKVWQGKSKTSGPVKTEKLFHLPPPLC